MSERQQDPKQTFVDATALRKRAEEQARFIEQTFLSAHSTEEIQRILHELRVHQIELEMQNEELRTAQMQIIAGRARYLDLYDLAPVGYCTISEKGIIFETNLTLTTMLGVNRQILIKKPFSAFILREDQDIYYLLLKETFDTDKPQTCELRMARSDKTAFWAFLQASALQDEDGTKSVRVAISDFSKQKMAEDQLRASEAENRAIVELVPDMIFRLGKDGQYLDIETSSDRYLALPVENLLKKNIKDVFPSEVASLMLDVIRKAVDTNTLQDFEYELAVPAGVTIFEARIQKLTNDEVLTFVRDITERKRAETALHESKQFLRFTLDGLSSHIVVINESGEIVLTNKAYRDFAECNQIEPSTVSEGCNYLAVCDAAQGEDSEEAGFFAQGIREVLSGKRPSFELEYPCHSPDEQRWFLGRVTPFKSGSPKRVIIAHENITARKQAEAAVWESEETLKEILESTLSGYWDWNLVDNTEYLSPTFKRIFGYEDHEMESSPEAWQRIIFPEDLPKVLECFNRHVKSHGREPFYSEVRYRHKDGSTVWVICAGRVNEWAEDGTARHMIGCHIDITKRELAEYASRKSENKYRSLFEQSVMGIYLHDMEGRIIDVNNEACLQLKYSKEELLNLNVFDLHPNKAGTVNLPKDEILCLWNHWQLGQQLVFEGEHQSKDGTIIPVQISTGPVEYEQGNRILAVVQDITARKQAKEKLTEQLHELQRWHAVMLDREDRVIELKREVNELLARIGQPPRYQSTVSHQD